MLQQEQVFPLTIKATLNHLLTVDWFYLDAIERSIKSELINEEAWRFFEPKELFDTCIELQHEQRETDERLIAVCRALLTKKGLGVRNQGSGYERTFENACQGGYKPLYKLTIKPRPRAQGLISHCFNPLLKSQGYSDLQANFRVKPNLLKLG